jgi:hypothetical protein
LLAVPRIRDRAQDSNKPTDSGPLSSRAPPGGKTIPTISLNRAKPKATEMTIPGMFARSSPEPGQSPKAPESLRLHGHSPRERPKAHVSPRLQCSYGCPRQVASGRPRRLEMPRARVDMGQPKGSRKPTASWPLSSRAPKAHVSPRLQCSDGCPRQVASGRPRRIEMPRARVDSTAAAFGDDHRPSVLK